MKDQTWLPTSICTHEGSDIATDWDNYLCKVLFIYHLLLVSVKGFS